MITTLAIALSAISALCALAAGIIASHHQRGTDQEANDINRFEAITTALEKRVSDLERELGTVKTALVTEQTAHRQTQDELRMALRYIRELITWARGDRNTPMPPPPAELEAEL